MHKLFWHYQTNQSNGSGFSLSLSESMWTPHIPAYPPASQSMSPSSSSLFIRRAACEQGSLLHQQRAWLRHCWQQGVEAGHSGFNLEINKPGKIYLEMSFLILTYFQTKKKQTNKHKLFLLQGHEYGQGGDERLCIMLHRVKVVHKSIGLQWITA